MDICNILFLTSQILYNWKCNHILRSIFIGWKSYSIFFMNCCYTCWYVWNINSKCITICPYSVTTQIWSQTQRHDTILLVWYCSRLFLQCMTHFFNRTLPFMKSTFRLYWFFIWFICFCTKSFYKRNTICSGDHGRLIF